LGKLETEVKFTFGIITAHLDLDALQLLVRGIENEHIPNYEIIVIGNDKVEGKHVRAFPFDESVKSRWITKKKNLIVEKATYENIVFMHDYLHIVPGWYRGFLKFGNDFDVCMTRVINRNGTRYRDWTLWAEDAGECGVDCKDMHYLLPYTVTHLSKYQYISGAYWIAKKSVMQEFPLDENKGWGEGEDVEWSKAVRQKYDFKINQNSIVRLIKKGKSAVFQEMTPLEQEYVASLKTNEQGYIILPSTPSTST
jgi:hypothetical protein